MSSAWTVVATTSAIATALAPFVVHRQQRASRHRNEERLDRLQVQYERELRGLRSLLQTLEDVRTDLHAVLADGPMDEDRLTALGLARRLDRLETALRGQMFGRAGVEALRERLRCILDNPYPDNPYPDAVAGGEPVRLAIGRGACQQAAAHAALDSLRILVGELQRRESELASKLVTLIAR